MCKINCSGGCEECAPDEHAFAEWQNEYGIDPHQWDVARAAYIAGWHHSKNYVPTHGIASVDIMGFPLKRKR